MEKLPSRYLVLIVNTCGKRGGLSHDSFLYVKIFLTGYWENQGHQPLCWQALGVEVVTAVSTHVLASQ
jgi:hypothetical protein